MLKNIIPGSGGSAKIGLDIGNFSIKMAQLQTRAFTKGKVLVFSSCLIEGDKTPDKVIEAIKEAHKQLGTNSKQVNLSISGPNVITRYVIIPKMDQSDIARALEFELEKYLPYKRDAVNSEFHVLSTLPNNKNLVLLVAAERGFINERMSLVREAGLVPSSVNIDFLALSEIFKTVLPDVKRTVALLDVGYRLSKLVILEKGVPYFSRDLETGEYNIIQMISKGMGLDFDAAKLLEIDPKDKAVEVGKIIKTEFNSLIDELSLSFEYCERNLDKRIDTLYLTGGGCRMNLLLESFEKIPNLRVNFFDPTLGSKATSSLSAGKMKEYAHFLAVSIGLALS